VRLAYRLWPGESRGEKKSLLPIDMRDSRRLTNNERRLTAAGRPDRPYIITYEACVFTIIYIIYCLYDYNVLHTRSHRGFLFFDFKTYIGFSRLNFSFSYAYILLVLIVRDVYTPHIARPYVLHIN